jgi:serine O-acetyltransferase
MSREQALIAESAEFFQASLFSSPLRRYAGLFDAERVASDQTLRDCLLSAHEDFRTDLARWQLRLEEPKELFERLLLAPQLVATYSYRVSRACFLKEVEQVPSVIAALSKLLTGTEIYYSSEIGPGLKLIHGVGCVIGTGCKVGSSFTVYQGVTLGDKLGRDTGKQPVIGDRVIVSAGAQVLGPVTIGSETVIGANSVVLDSVPGRSVVAGVPARVKIANLSDQAFGEFWAAIKG